MSKADKWFIPAGVRFRQVLLYLLFSVDSWMILSCNPSFWKDLEIRILTLCTITLLDQFQKNNASLPYFSTLNDEIYWTNGALYFLHFHNVIPYEEVHYSLLLWLLFLWNVLHFAFLSCLIASCVLALFLIFLFEVLSGHQMAP